jgi:RNase adapter protein RapZ
MRLFIVTGLSGSGKTIALQAFEDAGFYCMDNLPAMLLPHVAQELSRAADEGLKQVAVGVDARNRAFLAGTAKALDELTRLGISHRILFLDADETVLLKRFQETRRRHPMQDDETPLLDAIRLEKKLLEPLADAAALRIDTSRTTPHELRRQIQDYARGQETAGLTVLFESFGFKHGTPLDADFVFDVRCLPNPYWQNELRPYTGIDEPVIRFLEQYDDVRAMLGDLTSFLERWLMCFTRSDRNYVTVALGCTGGQHRSVYLVDRLAAHFAAKGIKTQVRHRELK